MAEEVVLIVDARAEPDGDGSPARPYAAVQQAVARAASLPNAQTVTIRVADGVYREAVVIRDFNGPRLTIEAANPQRAILSGAARLPRWKLDGAEPRVVSAPWPHRWGLAPIPEGWGPVEAHLRQHPVVLRRELVVAGEQVLRQVFSLALVHLTEASYFVDEPNQTLHVRLPPNVRAEDLEVGLRPHLLRIENSRHVVVRGLVFEHAATALPANAVEVESSRDVVVENALIRRNNWGALAALRSTDITFRRVACRDNGGVGMGAFQVIGLRVEDCEVTGTNWRGVRGLFTDWAVGCKFMSVRQARFVRVSSSDNHCSGWWLDWDNSDAVLEDCRFERNRTHGLFLEASQGPIRISRSRFVGNGETGILLTNTEKITIEDSTFAGNRQVQLHIPWQSPEHEARGMVDHVTGREVTLRTGQITLSRNRFAGSGDAFLLAIARFPSLADTLTSRHNAFEHQAKRDMLVRYDRLHGGPVYATLEQWRQREALDADSSYRIRDLATDELRGYTPPAR